MEENLKIITATKELVKNYIDELVAIDAYYFDNLAWNEESFLIDLPEKFEKSLLIFVDEKMIGYSIISKKENSYYHWHKLVLHKDFASKGYGKIIFKELFERLNGKKVVFKVDVSNINTVIYHLKNGAFFIERQNNYYHMMYNGE